MLNWITANLSTIVISAILLAIVTSISLHLIRQKKQGRSSCGCNCAHCAMHGAVCAVAAAGGPSLFLLPDQMKRD